ncbi:hypothetical protein NET02_05070 [Thermomicrobiaceae bacterium CFH 74404]|uniref:Uncharacterized protein n=1 Tax=Thermalbibacter longus TaxID=2951981 RepID=A0AA41WCJ5_9BACT|nr:hypothetical protein [Thermalbibacter longus]MCM8748508.1 hypothetical protein [Thermalbibacter longus]
MTVSRQRRRRLPSTPNRQVGPALLGLVLALSLWPALTAEPARAQEHQFASVAFARRWESTDQPVALGLVVRTWFWGPSPSTPALRERYRESPGQARLVQYFDKGRMEITDPAGDPNDLWYVTGGLLTRELVSGRIQVGDNEFLDTGSGASIPIAGDPDNLFPTYADLGRLIDQSQPDRTGEFATAMLSPEGSGAHLEAAGDPNAQLVQYVQYLGPLGQTVGYNIPRAFWDFMTQSGQAWRDGQLEPAAPLFDWVFVLGYPIADPFWAQVRLNGMPTWVLIQPFERRLLTYTPSNPPGWQVEMGNIGLHYYRWRYHFTPPTPLGDGASYYGLKPETRWVYGTNLGSDEVWETGRPTESFVAGSTLIPRRERGPLGTRITYWAITPSGVYLYGSDELDRDGNVVETVLLWPPVQLLAAANLNEGVTWSTESRVLSTRSPSRRVTVEVMVREAQLVSTTYGIVPAWQIVVTERGNPDSDVDTALIWFSPGLGIVQWIGDGYAAQLKAVTALQQ